MIMLLMDMIIVIISFFMIMVMKMTKKYAHNMTLMSKYEELLLDEKRPKHLGKALPSLFGQCNFERNFVLSGGVPLLD